MPAPGRWDHELPTAGLGGPARRSEAWPPRRRGLGPAAQELGCPQHALLQTSLLWTFAFQGKEKEKKTPGESSLFLLEAAQGQIARIYKNICLAWSETFPQGLVLTHSMKSINNSCLKQKQRHPGKCHQCPPQSDGPLAECAGYQKLASTWPIFQKLLQGKLCNAVFGTFKRWG